MDKRMETSALISDTLFDAVQEMRAYLRDIPETYAEVRPDLEKLIADMDAMRARLDAPPSSAGFNYLTPKQEPRT